MEKNHIFEVDAEDIWNEKYILMKKIIKNIL